MSGPVVALNVGISVVSDTAYAVSGGCLLAILWLNAVASGAICLRLLRQVLLACVAGLVLGQLVRPWFAAASMSGSDGFAENLTLIPDILSSTHAGKVWYLGSLGVAALVAIVFIAGEHRKAAAGWGYAASLLVIGCAKAASGHAASDGDFTLAEFSMLLHVLGTAVWAGTVIASGFIVVPALARFHGSAALWNYARILSRMVTWALIALLVSGLYTAWGELHGSLSGLWSSDWGRILLAKITFVSLALALGACTRYKCVQCEASDERTKLLVSLLRAEAAVMIVILCLSGLLGTTAPALM